MGRHRLLIPLAFIGAGCLAGSEPDGAPPPEFTPWNQEGHPCNTQSDSCADEWTLLECVDREWVAASCPELCVESADAHIDGFCSLPARACICEREDPDGCWPGRQWCDEDTHVSCSGTQEEQPIPCSEVCDSDAEDVACAQVSDDIASCVCPE